MRCTTSAIHRPTIKRTAVLWGPHRNQQSVPHGESGGRSYLVDLAVYVAPTYDFIQELRKFGSKLEVLKPAPPFSLFFLWLLSFIPFLFSQVQLGIACIYLLEFLLKKIQALSWLCKKTAKLTNHLKKEWGCSDLFRWYDENRDYGENGMFSKN